MNYLLDTNHLSPLVTIGHPLRLKILSLLQTEAKFSITAPALSEFLFGIGGVPRSQRNMLEWQYLKADFEIYSIDAQSAEQSAELRLDLRRRGKQIGLVDAFNAVIALRNDLILLTTDKDFLAILTLKQENWLR